MDAEIIAAIIGAVAVIGAAIINSIRKKKKADEKSAKIKQTAIGKDITQTGIQNNYYSEKKGEDNAREFGN